MNWSANKVLRGVLIGIILCALWAKMSSPVIMINRAEDATVILEIVRKVPVDSGPLLPADKHHTPRVENRTFLCAGYVADDYGHVVTAAHCVEGGRNLVSVDVILHGERTGYPAKVILKKTLLDIALIQAKLPAGTPYLKTKDDYEWPGTHLWAIGHPLGLFYSVSEGTVSGYGKGMNDSVFLQLTAPVNPGNSGGPILNDKGQVIGVCSFMAIAPWGTPAAGLNFAVPSPTINVVMKGHLNHY